MNGQENEDEAVACSMIDSNVDFSNVKVSTSILKLREEKGLLEAKLRDVENSLSRSLVLKEHLLILSCQLKNWTEKIKAANRNNQGVPYVRDVKAVCNEILTGLRKEDFRERFSSISEAEIPCFSLVSNGMDGLEAICSKVLQNEANYNAVWVEEMRQLIGKLVGSTNAILELHFEE